MEVKVLGGSKVDEPILQGRRKGDTEGEQNCKGKEEEPGDSCKGFFS